MFVPGISTHNVSAVLLLHEGSEEVPRIRVKESTGHVMMEVGPLMRCDHLCGVMSISMI